MDNSINPIEIIETIDLLKLTYSEISNTDRKKATSRLEELCNIINLNSA